MPIHQHFILQGYFRVTKTAAKVLLFFDMCKLFPRKMFPIRKIYFFKMFPVRKIFFSKMYHERKILQFCPFSRMLFVVFLHFPCKINFHESFSPQNLHI